MSGEQMQTGLSILSLYGKVSVTAEHDQVWLHMRDHTYDEDDVGEENEDGETPLVDPSPLTAEQAQQMDDADWFVDAEAGSWTHFC